MACGLDVWLKFSFVVEQTVLFGLGSDECFRWKVDERAPRCFRFFIRRHPCVTTVLSRLGCGSLPVCPDCPLWYFYRYVYHPAARCVRWTAQKSPLQTRTVREGGREGRRGSTTVGVRNGEREGGERSSTVRARNGEREGGERGADTLYCFPSCTGGMRALPQ